MKMSQLRPFFILISILSLVFFWIRCDGSGSTPNASLMPTSGNKIYTTDPVKVTFSEEMDQTSVEAAFSITGSDPVPGTFSWEGSTVTFTRESGLWKTNHEYTLTITTAAKNSKGGSLAEDFIQTFTPQLNMFDVNGDGIDDLLLGASRRTANGHPYAGSAYLLLGRAEWSDVIVPNDTADAIYSASNDGSGMGSIAQIVGDINGDGYADMAIGGLGTPGYVILFNGSESPASITLAEVDDAVPSTFETFNQVDGIFMGPAGTTFFGYSPIPVGDVNGDGLADMIFAGKVNATGNTKYWLVLGRTEPFPEHSASFATMPTVDDAANATYLVFGLLPSPGGMGLPAAGCDINGDELNDLILGSPASPSGSVTGAGKAFVIAGSETPADRDLTVESADETIIGAGQNNVLGIAVACGDVNADGYADLILSALGYGMFTGRVYVVVGGEVFADVDLATTAPQAVYTGTAGSFFGGVVSVPGDVTGDGMDDIVVGAPPAEVDGAQFRGQAFLFLGSETLTDVDLGAGGAAAAAYAGPIPPSSTSPGRESLLGMSRRIGDVNGDGIDDLILGAPVASQDGLLERGIVYLVFGLNGTPASVDFSTGSANTKFLGADADDTLSLTIPLY